MTQAGHLGRLAMLTIRSVGALVVAGVSLRLMAVVDELSGHEAAAPAVSGDGKLSNPVTAVLLQQRGYDTLLELGVVLVAGLIVSGLGHALLDAGGRQRQQSPLLSALAQILVPVGVVFAAYLLWAGAHAPGGAFQAGAVLAAMLVLAHIATGDPARIFARGRREELAAVSGFATFLAMGVVAQALWGSFLGFPDTYLGAIVLAIEVMATLAIGVTLAVLVVGGDLWAPGPSFTRGDRRP